MNTDIEWHRRKNAEHCRIYQRGNVKQRNDIRFIGRKGGDNPAEPLLNKNTRPNFETVRKILTALDYDLVVEKKKGAADPGEKEIADFFASTDEEQVSYECVQALFSTMGYSLELKTHKIEENVKQGIDNC